MLSARQAAPAGSMHSSLTERLQASPARCPTCRFAKNQYCFHWLPGSRSNYRAWGQVSRGRSGICSRPQGRRLEQRQTLEDSWMGAGRSSRASISRRAQPVTWLRRILVGGTWEWFRRSV